MKRTMVMLLALLFCVGAAAQNAGTLVIGDFESDLDGWTFSLGKEFPGAQGNAAQTTKNVQSGSGSAWMSGAFGEGGTYVALIKYVREKPEATELRFWVKTDGMDYVRVRLTGSDKQTHQQRIKLASSDDWQEVVITDFAPKGKSGYLSWGGDNDKVWRGPVTVVSILLDKGDATNTETKSGQIWLDNIRLISK